MKIIIDGIFFQIANTGIARVWRTLLERWCDSGFIKNIILIDRGYTAPQLEGVEYYRLPPFNYEEEALFSLKLQDICDQFNADLFISTYYTTPLSTPSILMIHDMIPEVIGLDLNDFWWREKHYAILYASQYITVSKNTGQDLIKFCPEVQPSQVNIIHNGVDDIFSPATSSEIIKIKNKFSINSPYLLLVGSRLSLNNYKNATILFKTLSERKELQKFSIVCVGGKKVLESKLVELSKNFDVCLIQPTDWELSVIYSGAIALVYPSLYEGFGLPIIEAMACGCPVITCKNSSLPEVGGEAVIYIDGQDVGEMARALEKIQNTKIRNTLIEKGKEQAKKFSWSTTADKISNLCVKTIEDSANRSKRCNFTSLWRDFRLCQAENLKYRFHAEKIYYQSVEANQLISHLQNDTQEKNQLIHQLETDNQTLKREIEEKNQLIYQLETEHQHFINEADDLHLQIKELSNTKKTIKRLCKKVLKKLFSPLSKA